MSAPEAKLAGIIGWPLGHSLSPLLHAHWMKEHNIAGAYIPLSIAPADFSVCVDTLVEAGFAGVNVTVPHKEAAYALASTHDAAASAVGAVNTLVFAGKKIHGLNTDVEGFAASFEETFDKDAAKRGPAVVLGAGGAARAIVYALVGLGAPEIRVLNRTRNRAEALVAHFDRASLRVMDWEMRHEALKGAEILVNATSLGLKGGAMLDISLDNLTRAAVVADIVYNPLETNLLAEARARGHATMDGLGMLMHQAAPAFAAWFGVTPKVTPVIRAVLEQALRG